MTSINFDDLSLRLDASFSLFTNDMLEDEYVEDIDVKIISDGLGECEDVKLGGAKLSIIDVAAAEFAGWSLESFAANLDDIEADLGAFALEVIVQLEELAIAYDLPLISPNHALKGIEIASEYRNRGVGSKVLKTLIENEILSWDLLAVKPFGIEEEKIDSDDSPKVRKSKERAKIGRVTAHQVLRKPWFP